MADLRLRVGAGVVAAGLTLGVAELLAALFGPDSEPLNVLGKVVVDHTPDGVREWAITSFGTNDKTVLYIGMAIVAFLVACLAGAVERTSRAAGSTILAAFGLITAAFALSRSGLTAALPVIIGVIAGIYALRWLTTHIDTAETSAARTTETPGTDPSAPQSTSATTQLTETMDAHRGTDATATGDTATPGSPVTTPAQTPSGSIPRTGAFERRQVLRGIGITAALAVAAGVGGRLLGAARRDVSGERAAVDLPRPGGAPVSIAPEADLRVPGLTPYLTSNADFYRIDTALIVPQVSVDDWSLRIHGMVDREIRLTWADLANRQAVEKLVTLACVSNPIGGDLVGNAKWLGYRLDELIAEAGPHPDADMVLSHSADGWTAGSPLSVLTDGRDALLAVGMNGEPLPVQHGYPARLVVPGLYGYVSATKWVTELEITRFDRATAYWTRRGWSAYGPIKTATRIDTPRARSRVSAGRIPIAGVAWAQHRGIRGVEVQIDNGPWQPARLAADQSADTWRQWIFDWDATPGAHTIRARATDGTGETQTAERVDVIPDGATGYAQIPVQVA
ncbi:molybdopterin-dependent oxidoreductase [Nocardia sp. NPDC052566]|uniref:molybdopterin-dependent oxidoreductase n=1 Tax=Nocardia sp. NPDC052566 TaxID=3364330 RepID=UPI0037C79AC5